MAGGAGVGVGINQAILHKAAIGKAIGHAGVGAVKLSAGAAFGAGIGVGAAGVGGAIHLEHSAEPEATSLPGGEPIAASTPHAVIVWDAAGARPQQVPVARGQFPEQHGKPVQIVNRLSLWKRLAFQPG